MSAKSQVVPAYLAACAGIALYSVMDAVMKAVSLQIGAYNTLIWRLGVAVVLTGILYAATRPVMPIRSTLRVHFFRAILVAVMAMAFFWGIVRVPLAEAIALSFIAPLIALALAALVLKEKVGPRSVLGSLLGLAGVAVVVAGRIGGTHSHETLLGMGAVLVSAVFYAVNLVVARHQAQLAKPLEIAFFQNMFVTGLLALAAPWFLELPAAPHWPGIGAAALLATASLLLLSWAYARAEAQILVTVEYTAFIWAAIMGWIWFDEPLTLATIAGTLLIVAGCLMAVRKQSGAPEAEAGLQ
ncbi:DMT family transporter [Sphingomonas sp. G-3-2-10]|uniref:DMT family transporter n=1 Tax=Sphingomonas sp. G-3-2-10 TaxID=2728838 RepID=UPI00146BB88F|nr:DMT family transporter [Sphingomonas sp. G-3-2-10]NML06991.1 DMT family transporter [Sphingomonas sp. G-3-2-10]